MKTIKVIVSGAKGSGKTTLISHLNNDKTPAVRNLISPVEFVSIAIDSEELTLSCWNINGNEVYQSIRPAYLRLSAASTSPEDEVAAAAVIITIDSRELFNRTTNMSEALAPYLEEIATHNAGDFEHLSKVPFLVVLTKQDLIPTDASFDRTAVEASINKCMKDIFINAALRPEHHVVYCSAKNGVAFEPIPNAATSAQAVNETGKDGFLISLARWLKRLVPALGKVSQPENQVEAAAANGQRVAMGSDTVIDDIRYIYKAFGGSRWAWRKISALDAEGNEKTSDQILQVLVERAKANKGGASYKTLRYLNRLTLLTAQGVKEREILKMEYIANGGGFWASRKIFDNKKEVNGSSVSELAYKLVIRYSDRPLREGASAKTLEAKAPDGICWSAKIKAGC